MYTYYGFSIHRSTLPHFPTANFDIKPQHSYDAADLLSRFTHIIIYYTTNPHGLIFKRTRQYFHLTQPNIDSDQGWVTFYQQGPG